MNKEPVLTVQEEKLPNHYFDDPSFVDEDKTPEAMEKQFKELQRSMQPGYVKLRSCEEIYDTVYMKRDPIVEGLIDGGTIILGGASKVGKSFLSLQLAYCVSQGLPFLGFPTNKTGVIYFALEDVERRIQRRMQKMFGLEPADNLYFATDANFVGSGFEEQLNTALHDHPDVGLVIIDVMQKIRNPEEQSAYAADYVFISALKELADRYGICLILVHHTRKTADADVFNMVSGSMGITAAVDGTMVLYKKTRLSPEATLVVNGRDIQDRELRLMRDWDSPKWCLLDEEAIPDLPRPPDKILSAVCALLSEEHPVWIGTAEALVRESGVTLKPNALSRYLGSHVMELKKIFFVHFAVGRTHEGRSIKLVLEPPTKEEAAKEDKQNGNEPQHVSGCVTM